MQLMAHLEKLLSYNAVVKAGSFRKAAISLRLTQPALSRAIAALERATDCRLLVRTPAGVEVTNHGWKLFEFSERVIRDATLVEGLLAHGDARLEPSILIGTYDSIAIYFFPKFLAHLGKKQRALKASLRTASSRQLIEDLKASRLDMIVSVNPPVSKGIVSQPLYRDSFGIYVSTETPKTNLSTCITVPEAQSSEGKSLRAHLEERGISSNGLLACESFETVLALCEEGLGVAALPTRVAERKGAQSKLKRLAAPPGFKNLFGEHEICFSYRKSREADVPIRWIQRELEAFLAVKTAL